MDHEDASYPVNFPAFVLCEKDTQAPFAIRVSGDQAVVACPIFESQDHCEFFGGAAPIELVMLVFDTPSGLYDYAVAIKADTDAECVLLGTEADPDTGLEFRGVLSLEDFLAVLSE